MKFFGKLPVIGKRIIKSAIGVWLCYIVQRIRGGDGIVFYSQLAVLWCIQPYVKDSIRNGIQRTIGTAIGALYGLFVILISVFWFPDIFSQERYYDLLVSFCIAAVLYTTVVLKKKNTSYFSTVVFLSIVVNHIRDANPVLFVWNRVLDTMIGIVLGVGINMFRIPRKKQQDILFVSGIDDTLLNEKEVISPYSKIEINRMLEEGAKFTVSTLRTPASVIDALDGIKWKLPLIVMDGAALYDMNERKYLKIVKIDKRLSEKIKKFFDDLNMNCFMNIVIDGLLVISYKELKTDTEKMIYKTLHRSPYRNFVNKDLSRDGDILYYMAVGEETWMDQVYAKLQSETFFEQLKILYYPSSSYPGQMYLKIYDKNARKENMISYLKKYTKAKRTLTFGSIEGKYDITVHSNETNVVAHTLEKVYEPYFFLKE